MNFLTVLLNSLKAKIMPLWTKAKMWTNPTFIKAKATTAIRQFFTKTLSVRPRHKKDYYGVFGWLVSKKLCFAILMVIGVFSLYYLIFVNPVLSLKESSDGMKTYYYHSIPLRFVDGGVRVKAKSGYIAYIGDVKDGAVEGQGSLYDKDGGLVYVGAFDNNKFNGLGKRYFKNGQLQYEGDFIDNYFDGSGALYRDNGSKEYIGAFSKGMKDGDGVLYDASSKQVYVGQFTKDHLVYSTMLGKSTKELSDIYTGERMIYRGQNDFIVQMKDINALYCGRSDEEMLNDEMMVEGIYVLDNHVFAQGKECTNISQLNEVFGSPYYEGNSAVLLPEAIAINCMNENSNSLLGRVTLKSKNLYKDVVDVESFDSDYIIYLYSYRYDGLMYTFFCGEKYGNFAMYLIEKE